MNPEHKGWDQNLKLGKGFFLTLVMVTPMVLWFAWPWLKDEPFTSIVAGSLVIPFCASVVVYSFLKILNLIFIKKEITRTQIRALTITLILAAGAFLLVWKIQGPSMNPFWAPGLISFLAVIVYNLLDGKFGRK